MGQRHQVYIFYHKNSKDDKTLPDTINCAAFHSQWCYGSLPLRHVKRLAQFQKRANAYNRLSSGHLYHNISDMLRSILCLDQIQGSYSNYFDILSEVTFPTGGINPNCGDNNDGITLIYVPSKSKVLKYCFMWLEHKRPISALQYATHYYKPTDLAFKRCRIVPLVKWLDKNCELLTQSECHKLLPEWYRPEIERRNIRKAKRAQLPFYADCLPQNKKLYEKRMKVAT